MDPALIGVVCLFVCLCLFVWLFVCLFVGAFHAFALDSASTVAYLGWDTPCGGFLIVSFWSPTSTVFRRMIGSHCCIHFGLQDTIVDSYLLI